MKLNPKAVVFWLFLAGVGYLIGGIDGAVFGAVIGMGISILDEVFS